MSRFKAGFEEVERTFQMKQWRRRQRTKVITAIVVIALIAFAILGYMYLYRIGPFAGMPYTGAATLVLKPYAASGISATQDEYLGPISYWVVNPADNTTIESGSITAADDWEVEVDIPAGHPGYVYVAMTPPNNTYYLFKPLSDETVKISGRLYYKIDITQTTPGQTPRIVVRAEYLKIATLNIQSEGNVTFSGTIFTTNIIFNISKEAGLYNATLMMKLNVSNLKIDTITLNGTTITWYHDDTDNDDIIDKNEAIYVWISGKDFLTNIEDKTATYVLALTFSNATITSGQKIKATITFTAYKFDPEQPFVWKEMTKITVATATAYYTKS